MDHYPDEKETHYTDVDSVAATLGLSDPNDPMSLLRFSDSSNPSADFIRDLILAAEDEIDRRTRRTWRETRVKDYITTISSYQWDENAYRSAYYQSGGYEITLRRDLRPWDPTKGDRLQLRTRMNQWVDISGGDQYVPSVPLLGEDPPQVLGGYGNLFWFDEPSGRLFLKYRYLSPRFNALCITYRYGSSEPVPPGIKRLCNLIVASNVLTMDFYMVKVGMGGDISGRRDEALKRWDEETNRLYSAFQRSGSVHSLYR